MPALFYAAVVLAFILGSGSSTTIIIVGHRHGVRWIYAFAILAESLLLGQLGSADVFILTT
jgi:hypothetical protein